MINKQRGRLLLCLVGLSLCSCIPRPPEPGTVLIRTGDEISICGYLFHTGTRVILWNDTGGFDAYRLHRRFDPESEEKGPTEKPDRLARYGSLRGGISDDIRTRYDQKGWALADLRQVVDRVVVHFDACGTSQRCFEVLHDIRGLSCHFLLDADGTIYQTLDIKERAWHAAELNDRSIGIEIAHIGAHPDRTTLDEWYVPYGEEGRLRVNPDKLSPSISRKYVARPVTDTLHRGVINEKDVMQYDFTEAQYRALEMLLITLCRVMPAIPPTVPRDADGAIVPGVLGEGPGSEAGVVGHFHGSVNKVDPGPAFDWDRIERALERVDR